VLFQASSLQNEHCQPSEQKIEFCKLKRPRQRAPNKRRTQYFVLERSQTLCRSCKVASTKCLVANLQERTTENSKIEWCDHTFNPWYGCTNVSPGCDYCNAECWSKRSGLVKWGNNPRKRTTESYWKKPIKWNAHALAFKRQYGHWPRVFCASLADVFDNQVPPEWRQDLFALVREYTHHAM